MKKGKGKKSLAARLASSTLSKDSSPDRGWNWRKWLDDSWLALKGVWLSLSKAKFWLGFCATFVIFGILMNLIAGGTAKWKLMFSGNFWRILGECFISLFGVGQNSADWIPGTLIVILQSVLIGLLTFLAGKKKKASYESKRGAEITHGLPRKTSKTAARKEPDLGISSSNADGAQNAGIVAGLVALGAGCPTCGTTLISALLGAVFSTGGLAVAGAVSGVLTFVAVLVAMLTIRRLGLEAYVIIKAEKYDKKQRDQTERKSMDDER